MNFFDIFSFALGRASAGLSSGPVITRQPTNQAVSYGDKAYFSVTVRGKGLNYLWQYSANDGQTWTNSTFIGYNTNTLQVASIEENEGLLFHCIIVDENGMSVTSNSAKLVFQLEIVTQPIDFVGSIGDTATFTVVARGENLSYNWQWLNNSGEWKDQSYDTFHVPTLRVSVTATRIGYTYRCRITDMYSNVVISNVVKIVDSSVLTIVTQPVNVTTVVGQKAYFEVTAAGENLTYKWQYSNDGGTTWTDTTFVGYNTNRLQVTAAATRNGFRYHCIVTDGNGARVISNSAILLIDSIVITSQPVNYAGPIGDTAYFTVDALGAGLTYQWQYWNGTRWANTTVTGNKTNTITMQITTQRLSYKYRCVIYDENGQGIISNEVCILQSSGNSNFEGNYAQLSLLQSISPISLSNENELDTEQQIEEDTPTELID